ncbi:MAG: iron uptake porin [Pleurocapsa sp.]
MQLFKFFLISLSLIFVHSTPVKGTPITQVKDIQEEESFSTPAVSEISNVNSNSYDYQALQSLNSRYQCLNNNETLERSPEIITRNHFAVLLYQCFNNLQQNNNLLTQEDIAIIQRLRQNFETNFVGLKTRIAQLENRVATLEKNIFSSQVKLEGEAIIAVADVWQKDNDSNLTLGNRLRLDFITSFTAKDQLQIRLQGRNIPEFESVTGTNMSNLGFDGADDNEVEIDEIEYEILLTENTTLNLYGVGGGMGDLIPAINSEISGSGDGAISLFGRENPIRRQAEGAAIAISQDFGKKFNFSAGYVSNDASDPESGLFTTSYGAIAQLIFAPNETLNLSMTYNHTANNVGTGTGSELAENPFENSEDITTNGLGGEFSWLIQPNLSLGGRVGWIQASAKDLPNKPQADILTWAMMLGVTDLGKEDSLLGVIFGQPPKAINNDLGEEFEDPDTAYHLELFYRWQLTDDLAITPGFFTIFNPEHDRNNHGIVVGTVRTTVEF